MKSGDILTYNGPPPRFVSRGKLKLLEPTKASNYPSLKYWMCEELLEDGVKHQPIKYSEKYILSRYRMEEKQ